MKNQILVELIGSRWTGVFLPEIESELSGNKKVFYAWDHVSG